MRIGFDNEKYLKMQSEHILERSCHWWDIHNPDDTLLQRFFRFLDFLFRFQKCHYLHEFRYCRKENYAKKEAK